MIVGQASGLPEPVERRSCRTGYRVDRLETCPHGSTPQVDWYFLARRPARHYDSRLTPTRTSLSHMSQPRAIRLAVCCPDEAAGVGIAARVRGATVNVVRDPS